MDVPVSFVEGDRVVVRVGGAERVGLVEWRRLLRDDAGEVRELFEVRFPDGGRVVGVPAAGLTGRPLSQAERQQAARMLVDRVAGEVRWPVEGSSASDEQLGEAAALWTGIQDLLRRHRAAFPAGGGKMDVPEDLVQLCLEAVLARDTPTPLEDVDENPNWLF